MIEDSLPVDIVTLIDDKGVKRKLELLDFENTQERFYALMPNFELSDESLNKDETYFIFEIV